MASPQGAAATTPPEPPKIHEATLASGPSGAVLKRTEIDFATAVARRRAGENIVVCGNNLKENRALARAVEAAVGQATKPQKPHTTAGPAALPHFQQVDPGRAGHSFY